MATSVTLHSEKLSLKNPKLHLGLKVTDFDFFDCIKKKNARYTELTNTTRNSFSYEHSQNP